MRNRDEAALRIDANGAARGDVEAAVRLINGGQFASIAAVARYIAVNQRVTVEVFGVIETAWEIVHPEAHLGR